MLYNATEHEKRCVKDEFEKMLEIIYLYYKLDGITEFVLDLQIYSGKYSETEPRIWLSAPKNHLGINLMLYSVKLCTVHEKVPNEEAIDVFTEYIKFYSENKDLFTLYLNEEDNYKPTAKITFEVSNRD